jgi:hypothetical protein
MERPADGQSQFLTQGRGASKCVTYLIVHDPDPECSKRAQLLLLLPPLHQHLASAGMVGGGGHEAFLDQVLEMLLHRPIVVFVCRNVAIGKGGPALERHVGMKRATVFRGTV